MAEKRPGWEPYVDFLRVADGATFGSVDMWSQAELGSKQFFTREFPGGSDRWLVIGQALYEPLALERWTGALRLFRRDGDPEGEPCADLPTFLERVFGAEYVSVVPGGEDDEWWELLARTGLR